MQLECLLGHCNIFLFVIITAFNRIKLVERNIYNQDTYIYLFICLCIYLIWRQFDLLLFKFSAWHNDYSIKMRFIYRTWTVNKTNACEHCDRCNYSVDFIKCVFSKKNVLLISKFQIFGYERKHISKRLQYTTVI